MIAILLALLLIMLLYGFLLLYRGFHVDDLSNEAFAKFLARQYKHLSLRELLDGQHFTSVGQVSFSRLIVIISIAIWTFFAVPALIRGFDPIVLAGAVCIQLVAVIYYVVDILIRAEVSKRRTELERFVRNENSSDFGLRK